MPTGYDGAGTIGAAWQRRDLGERSAVGPRVLQLACEIAAEAGWYWVRSPSPLGQVSARVGGYRTDMQTAGTDNRLAATERRRRRQELLDSRRQAAELRARLHPRANALARSRALLHARTTRG
ncbi:MAG: hypothetical protein NVS3B26_12660 [Mycobacteriales bacterium]